MRKVLLVLMILLLKFPVYSFSEYNIYMSNDGDDNNPGTSISSPVKTLSRAQELVDFSRGANHIIHIRGGVYKGETVYWTNTSPDYSLTIQPYEDEKPVFDGEGHP
ncbi:MAG: hypothetical protein GY754_03075 [bacterium]|nr:hypothetical protein [bacterium]